MDASTPFDDDRSKFRIISSSFFACNFCMIVFQLVHCMMFLSFFLSFFFVLHVCCLLLYRLRSFRRVLSYRLSSGSTLVLRHFSFVRFSPETVNPLVQYLARQRAKLVRPIECLYNPEWFGPPELQHPQHVPIQGRNTNTGLLMPKSFSLPHKLSVTFSPTLIATG